VKEEPSDNDFIMIESDEMEAEGEESELEDDEQVKVEAESTENDKLQEIIKKQVEDAFEKLKKNGKSKKAAIIQCPNCNKVLSSNTKLKQNIAAVHEKKTRFSCPHCPKGFFYKQGLHNHITQSHTFTNDDTTNSNRPFACDTNNCGKFFKTKSDLMHHQLVHSSEFPM
jgi:uncharacterized C2H2 Zn-finger protein